MRKTAIPLLVLVLLGLLGLDHASASNPAWSAAEHEIWILEEQYIARLKEGDLERLALFWHEDFIGWPSHSAEPVNRSEARASIENLLQSVRIVDFELQPRAIRCEGNLALVYYTAILQIMGDEGTAEQAAYRITHTWVKDHGEWRVLGGMSARVETES